MATYRGQGALFSPIVGEVLRLEFALVAPPFGSFTNFVRGELIKEFARQKRMMLDMFEATTKTWSDGGKVFRVRRDRLVAGALVGVVSTTSQKYLWVNDGTRPHAIFADGKWMPMVRPIPKTEPGLLSSRHSDDPPPDSFRIGPVHHPGIEPRKFDEAVAREVRVRYAAELQGAINRGVEKWLVANA